MRDVLIGGTGVVLGGMIGIGGTVLLEVVVAGAIAGTVFFVGLSATEAPVPVAGAATQAAVATPAAAPVPAAAAGQIQLITMAPVQPLVDGIPMPFDPTQGFLVELAEGTHRLQILDMLARPVVDENVVVTAGMRTQLRWAKKALTNNGQMPMSGVAGVASAAAAIPTQPVVPAAHAAQVEAEIARAEAEIAQHMAEVDAHMADVEAVIGIVDGAAGSDKPVEAIAKGVLGVLSNGDGGVKIPKLGGKRLKGR